MLKKIISFILVFCLCLALIPSFGVFATGVDMESTDVYVIPEGATEEEFVQERDRAQAVFDEIASLTVVSEASSKRNAQMPLSGEGDGEDGLYPWVGDGSEDSPFLIQNKADFEKLRDAIRDTPAIAAQRFRLTQDIRLNSEEGWEPLGSSEYPFTGILDGNNKTIYNLTIANTNRFTGMFGFTADAIIYDLNLISVNISGTDYVGGLIGYVSNTTVSNCSVSGTITASKGFVGGICGTMSNSTIEKSDFSGYVNNTGINLNTGGIASVLTNSHAIDCKTTGTITSTYDYSGGITGLFGSAVRLSDVKQI